MARVQPPELTVWQRFVYGSRLPLLAVGVVAFLIASTVTRLALLISHVSQVTHVWGWWLPSFGVGLVFDLFTALCVTFPFMLILLAVPNRWLKSTPLRWLMGAGFVAFCAGLSYLIATEYFYFQEYDARFNYVAVDYLIYPHEVFVNISESYPVYLFMSIAVVIGIVGFLLVRRWLWREASRPSNAWYRLLLTGSLAVIIVGGFIGLNINRSQISANRVLNEITANGIYSFFHAFYTNELDYTLYYSMLPEADAYERLRQLVATRNSRFLASDNPESIAREVTDSLPERPMNVVLVIEESFGSRFIGSLTPAGPNLAPNIDSLSGHGLMFANVYATGNRTVRGIEACLASFPPIPGRSIVKRPGNNHVFTLPSIFKEKGYQTVFLYGGHSYFDNVGPFARGNEYDRVIDQADFPIKTFSTIWGVCDGDLFDNSLRVFDSLSANHKPFFATVLTVSNHSPFTFPTGEMSPEPRQRTREGVGCLR